jgi:hypothetical protein
LLLQFLNVPAAALSRYNVLAKFVDGCALYEIMQVFPGSAPPPSVPLFNGFIPGFVLGAEKALLKFFERIFRHELVLLGT